MYNIHNYIKEKRQALCMTLESVLGSIKGNAAVELLPNAHKSLARIKEEPFYVGTNFKQISSNLNSRFILVSAPGATGKSAFGKYIAYLRNAIYWNLVDLSIGDGTFQGTLYNALGVSKISDYANKLHNGEMTLVIDAFDEAEIRSGRNNVEIFLREANEFLEGSTYPSIVLLSRTETAQNIATYFRANKIPFIHFEIDYFPENKAKDFVLKTAEKRKKVTMAIRECTDEYFSQIRVLIQDKEVIMRFLGYAPVLEAIATHITEISNTAKLLSDLRDGTDEIFLIHRIMDNLLEREHNKFIAAFKAKIGEDAEKIDDWQNIYNNEEQLIRLLNYVLFGKIYYSDFPLLVLPEYLVDDYIETISLFLPQHPFIQNSFEEKATASIIEFAGPAFRDYSLANIILKADYEASAELYYQRESAAAHFPSQLFWDHYINLNDNRISSRHFTYLFEAYKSKINIGSQTYLDIAQDDEGTYATFRITKAGEVIDTTNIEVDVVEGEFVFDNISNTSINVNDTIILEQSDHSYITDSTIICDKLIIKANTLTLNAFAPSMTTICCDSSMDVPKTTPLNIIVNATGEIQIDIPNIYEFPKLSRFKHNIFKTDTLDIYVFVHNLRRIFSSFRTHKKDMPARDIEKVDYVVINGNSYKKDIFDYLLQKNIVFKEGHLYKINLDNMSAIGISWGALISTDIKQLNNIYGQFCDWIKSK